MLRAAEDLADTISLADVRRQVQELVGGDLKPSYIGLAILDGAGCTGSPTQPPPMPWSSPPRPTRSGATGRVPGPPAKAGPWS